MTLSIIGTNFYRLGRHVITGHIYTDEYEYLKTLKFM